MTDTHHSSKIHRRVSGGRCRVLNIPIIDELERAATEYEMEHNTANRPSFESLNEPRPTTCPAGSIPQRDMNAFLRHNACRQDWLNNQQIDMLRKKADSETRKTRDICEPLIERKETLMKDIEELIEQRKYANLRKKEVLHKKWDENVYRPMKEKIKEAMATTTYEEQMKKRYLTHREFLEYINKRNYIFLDTFAPDEYFPFSLHPTRPSALKARTRLLKDPLHLPQRLQSSERRIELDQELASSVPLTDKETEQMQLPALPLVPLGRHGTNSRTWRSMHYGHIDSPHNLTSRRKIKSYYNLSNFRLDDWSRQYGQEQIDLELHCQTRRKYPMYHLHSQLTQFYQDQDMDPDVSAKKPQPIVQFAPEPSEPVDIKMEAVQVM